MRQAGAVILICLLVVSALPVPAAGSSSIAGEGPLPTRDLVQAAKALDRDDADAARDHVADARRVFEDGYANHSLVPADTPRGVLDELANTNESGPFRDRLVAFETALFELVASNVDAHLDNGSLQDARAWLLAGRAMVDTPGRRLPYDRPLASLADGSAPARADVQTALDATAAFRLLEVVQTADDLQAADDPAWRVHADRAASWWQVVEPRARARLPDAAFDPLSSNVSRLEDRLADRDEPGPLPSIRGPLTALAYHRSIERLDEVAAGVEAGIFALHRTVRQDPLAVPDRREAFLADYGRHRQFLGVVGEGDIRPLDREVLALNRSAANLSGVGQAAADAADELRRVGLLDYGIVLEVQHLAIRTDRVHQAQIRLLRPPLQGLSGYEVTIGYDPAVASVENVTARRFERNHSWSAAGGTLTFGGEADRFTQGAIVAHLHLLGVGEPGSSTGLNVTSRSFTRVDGEPAEVFFVRDGQATVAEILVDDGDDDGGDGDGSGSPLPAPGAVLAALAVVLAALGRRR